MMIKPVRFGKLVEFGTRKLWSIIGNENIRNSVTGKVTLAAINNLFTSSFREFVYFE